jgi:hypothetical protein
MAVLEERGRGLPEVVRERPEHHGNLPCARKLVDLRARFIHHHQRVDPHVAFRVPVHVLHAADQRPQLRRQRVDDAKFERERKANRWLAREAEQFLELAPDALGRQVVEMNRPAQRDRRRFERQVEARRELQRPQDAQAVVAKGPGIDDAEHAPIEIGAAAVRIEVSVRQRIPADRVDREVAAPGGLERHVGIALTVKPLWPRPVFDSRRGSATSIAPTL